MPGRGEENEIKMYKQKSTIRLTLNFLQEGATTESPGETQLPGERPD